MRRFIIGGLLTLLVVGFGLFKTEIFAAGQLSEEEMKQISAGACDDSCVPTDSCEIRCSFSPCLSCEGSGNHKDCAGLDPKGCVRDKPIESGDGSCGHVCRGDCQGWPAYRCICYQTLENWCPRRQCHNTL